MSDCYEKIGDYKLSLKYSRLYDELNKDVLDNENRLQFLEFQKSFDLLNRETKINQLNQLNTNNSLKLENKNLQLNRYIIIVISLSLLFFVSWILFIQISKRNRALMQAKSELQIKEANEKERNRISREMHDDIGAGLTQITLMTEFVRNKINYKELDDIAGTSRQLVSSMSEIIWSLSPEHKTINDLFNYLREQLNKLLEYTEIEYNIYFADINQNTSLTNEQRRNILLVVKEITNNAIKYSNAKHIYIKANYSNNELHFTIKDNGVGFDASTIYKGNGLKNIKYRIEEIGGTITMQSNVGKGCAYEFFIPVT